MNICLVSFYPTSLFVRGKKLFSKVNLKNDEIFYWVEVQTYSYWKK